VIVTDGRDNANKRNFAALAQECARLNVPLHGYGVGSSGFGQLQVHDMVTPDTLFVDDVVQVPVRSASAASARQGHHRVEVRRQGGGRARAGHHRENDTITLRQDDPRVVRQPIERAPTAPC